MPMTLESIYEKINVFNSAHTGVKIYVSNKIGKGGQGYVYKVHHLVFTGVNNTYPFNMNFELTGNTQKTFSIPLEEKVVKINHNCKPNEHLRNCALHSFMAQKDLAVRVLFPYSGRVEIIYIDDPHTFGQVWQRVHFTINSEENEFVKNLRHANIWEKQILETPFVPSSWQPGKIYSHNNNYFKLVQTGKVVATQDILIMDRYKYTMSSYLNTLVPTSDEYSIFEDNLHSKFINLMQEVQIGDIKPDNIVVNTEEDIRFIDLDEQFCIVETQSCTLTHDFPSTLFLLAFQVIYLCHKYCRFKDGSEIQLWKKYLHIPTQDLIRFVELHINRIKQSDSKLFIPFVKYFLDDDKPISSFSEVSQQVVSYMNRIYGCK